MIRKTLQYLIPIHLNQSQNNSNQRRPSTPQRRSVRNSREANIIDKYNLLSRDRKDELWKRLKGNKSKILELCTEYDVTLLLGTCCIVATLFSWYYLCYKYKESSLGHWKNISINSKRSS